MKIRPAGTESFHADRQTDMTNLMVTFLNSANAPIKKLCVRKNTCSVFFKFRPSVRQFFSRKMRIYLS